MTFFEGNTTIPFYGKFENQAEKYLIAPVISQAFSELFIRYVSELKNFQQLLTNDKKHLKKFILSESFLKKISACSYDIVEKIYLHRRICDRLYENYFSACQNLERNKADNESVTSDAMLELQQEVNKAKEKFDNHFDKLIQILKKCANDLGFALCR